MKQINTYYVFIKTINIKNPAQTLSFHVVYLIKSCHPYHCIPVKPVLKCFWGDWESRGPPNLKGVGLDRAGRKVEKAHFLDPIRWQSLRDKTSNMPTQYDMVGWVQIFRESHR